MKEKTMVDNNVEEYALIDLFECVGVVDNDKFDTMAKDVLGNMGFKDDEIAEMSADEIREEVGAMLGMELEERDSKVYLVDYA